VQLPALGSYRQYTLRCEEVKPCRPADPHLLHPAAPPASASAGWSPRDIHIPYVLRGPTGPARRVYSLTDVGRVWLDQWAGALDMYRRMLDQFFGLYDKQTGREP